jgi:hypothetical protein
MDNEGVLLPSFVLVVAMEFLGVAADVEVAGPLKSQ